MRAQKLSILNLLFAFALFLSAAFAISLSPVQAQESVQETSQTKSSVADVQTLIDSAKEKGMAVVVISPPADTSENVVAEPTFAENALAVRTKFRAIVEGARDFPTKAMNTLLAASPDGTLNWLWIAIGTAIGGILFGMIPAIFIRRMSRNYFRGSYNPNPGSLAEKVSFLLFRAFIILVNLTFLFVVSMAAALIFDSGHEPSRQTIFTIVFGYILYNVLRLVVFLNMLVPDVPPYRVINLSDKDAERSHNEWKVVLAFSTILLSICGWMNGIGLSGDAHKLALIGSLLLIVIMMAILTLKQKEAFAGIILGKGAPEAKPWWRRALASSMYIVGLAYLAFSWLVSSIRIIMDLPNALMIVAAPIIAFFAGMAAYGIALVLIDRFYQMRAKRFDDRVEQLRMAEAERYEIERAALARVAAEDADDEDEEVVLNLGSTAEDKPENFPVFKPVFKPLLEQAFGILISIFCIGFLLSTWDVNIGERGNPITAFMDTLMVIFVAWLLFQAVVIAVNSELENQGIGGEAQAGEPGEEMSGQGASRMATLLPLLRIVATVTIVILAAMIVLSNLGVDIAPLFAGAGVVGLAVGFGAQTLIRDIFSGGFFLFDDAFRKGEYIELGQIKGTVEKISLRSFQLRHHNGPIHTIPFGEITQLTNYSRDWVMMKLPLRVTYDTDVERVRKLVKKLGQTLMERDDIGKNFLQPLKSQGVYRMEDSAMIIRVKFMTKPGDQFVTRKVVYQEMRNLFEREGIKFAHKEVTVRLADEPTEQLTLDQKKAVSSAAKAALDDDEVAAAGKAAQDDGP